MAPSAPEVVAPEVVGPEVVVAEAVAPVVAEAPAAEAEVPVAAAPEPAAPRQPRIELGFRDGSTAALAPGSEQARALRDIASALTHRD